MGRSLFGWFTWKSAGRRAPTDSHPTRDETIQDLKGLIKKGKLRLERFLFTRSKETGVVREEKTWKLTRTAPGLFRIDSDHVSVMVHTSPFLVKKNDKITGVIRMSEGSLCRIVHEGGGPVELLLASDDLDPEILTALGEDVHRKLPEEALPSVADLAFLDDFSLHLVLSRAGSHLIAHLLLHLDSDAADRIVSVSSIRSMQSIRMDLDALIHGAARPELNPHSRIYSLQETDRALRVVRKILADQYRDERRKKERWERQKQLSLNAVE